MLMVGYTCPTCGGYFYNAHYCTGKSTGTFIAYTTSGTTKNVTFAQNKMTTCKYCPARLTPPRRVCDSCKAQRKRERDAAYKLKRKQYERKRGKALK